VEGRFGELGYSGKNSQHWEMKNRHGSFSGGQGDNGVQKGVEKSAYGIARSKSARGQKKKGRKNGNHESIGDREEKKLKRRDVLQEKTYGQGKKEE